MGGALNYDDLHTQSNNKFVVLWIVLGFLGWNGGRSLGSTTATRVSLGTEQHVQSFRDTVISL